MLDTEHFDLELERLREAGVGLGLDDEEIDTCMIRALKVVARTQISREDALAREQEAATQHGGSDGEIKDGDSAGKTRKNERRSCANKGCKVALCVFVTLWACYMTMNYCPWIQSHVMTFLEPYSYHILRTWRLLVLPIARSYDLTGWYDEECFLDNPFMKAPDVNCLDYAEVKNIPILGNVTQEEFKENFQYKANVLVFRNESNPVVAYTTLRKWYNDNQQAIQRSGHMIQSFGATPSEVLSNYTSKDIKAQSDFQSIWISKSVSTSRLFRQLFPRPPFLSTDSEYGISKTLFVNAPTTGTYSLLRPKLSYENIWYVQGSGTRRLYFIPDQACSKKKRALQVTVGAGDIVYYQDTYWRVDSSPVKSEKNADVAVGFLGTYSE